MRDDPDVLIIGGGPGGLSAVLWCADLGISAVLIERGSQVGGQLNRIYGPIYNYPGVRAASGKALLDLFLQSVDQVSDRFIFNADVSALDLTNRTATLSNGETFNAKSIIVATGVSRRKLNVEGEVQFEDKGILASGKRDADKVTGKTVAIVGGGDAALENALILSKTAVRVVCIHRRETFTARRQFLDEAIEKPNIDFIAPARVTRLIGQDHIAALEIETGSGYEKIDVDAVLIRIGIEPNTALLAGQVDLDDRGYVVIDAEGRTSVEGVWAVGDVANPVSPTIVSAAGTGATAAKSIFDWLVRTKQL